MSQMESNNRKARSCPNGHVFEDKELEYCPECGLPLRDLDNKAQSSSAHTTRQDSTQDFNGNRIVLSGNAPQTNPNEGLNQESSSTEEVKKPKKRLLRIVILLLMLYIVTVGIICGVGYKTGNLDLLKTGLDLSIAGKYIFPEQYQLVAERAEMEKGDSKGVIVYYKNKTGDVILYRERLELSPGYHEINPPDFFGQRKYYGESSHKTYVDENGHADPNIFHFYYDDPAIESSSSSEKTTYIADPTGEVTTNTDPIVSTDQMMITVPVFSVSGEQLLYNANKIIDDSQSWNENTAPQNLYHFPLLPDDLFTFPNGEVHFENNNYVVKFNNVWDLPYNIGYLYCHNNSFDLIRNSTNKHQWATTNAKHDDPESGQWVINYDLAKGEYSDLPSSYPYVTYYENVGWAGGYASASKEIEIRPVEGIVLCYDMSEGNYAVTIGIVSFIEGKKSVYLYYSPDDGHLINIDSY